MSSGSPYGVRETLVQLLPVCVKCYGAMPIICNSLLAPTYGRLQLVEALYCDEYYLTLYFVSLGARRQQVLIVSMLQVGGVAADAASQPVHAHLHPRLLPSPRLCQQTCLPSRYTSSL